jgi:VanZ family protein
MFFPIWLRNKKWHTVLCVIFILILSLMPQDRLPKASFTSQDLVVHIIMYGGLASCLSLSLFDKIREHKIRIYWYIPFVLGLFGLIVEVLQKILPVNRFFSLEDAACNFIGACSFYMLASYIQSIKK